MSGMFLTRRLALWQHLEREHLPKEGLRYWFHNDKVHGPRRGQRGRRLPAQHRPLVPAPARRARRAPPRHRGGRGGRARSGRPASGRSSSGTSTTGSRSRGTARRETVACRWVLDATGRATFLGKRLGLIERNERAPHRRGLVPLGGRAPHRRPRRPRSAVALPRQRRLAPPGHQPLHGLRLLGLVHPPGQRRDQRRRRLRHPARPSRPGQGPGARLPGLPAARSPWPPSCSRAPACGSEDLRTYSNLAYATRAVHGRTAGRCSATPRPSSIPTTRRGSTMPRSRVEATVEIVKAQTAGEDVTDRIAGAQRDLPALLPPLLPSRSTRTSTSTWGSTTCSPPRS